MENFVAALELASGKPFKTGITASAISWRLKAIKDQPTAVNNKVLVLREFPDHQGASFRVETIR